MNASPISHPRTASRVLVAGAGSIGLRHARLWREVPGVQVGICDSNPEFLARARPELCGAETWTDFSSALEWRPDIAVVAVPHHLHAELTCAAFEAGADVLCEKPMSLDVAESLKMAAAASENGRVLRVGFVNRFHPGLVRLKHLMETKALGCVLHSRYEVGSYETLVNSRSRYQSALPGALVMDYVHGIDLLLWLLGEIPCGVYAKGIQGGDFEFSSSPNLCEAVFDYKASMLASMQLDYAIGPLRHTTEVIGDRAAVKVDLIHGKISIRDRLQDTITQEVVSLERDDLFRAQIQDFLDIRAAKPGKGCSPQEGIQTTAVMQSVLTALGTQERIPISKGKL